MIERFFFFLLAQVSSIRVLRFFFLGNIDAKSEVSLVNFWVVAFGIWFGPVFVVSASLSWPRSGESFQKP